MPRGTAFRSTKVPGVRPPESPSAVTIDGGQPNSVSISRDPFSGTDISVANEPPEPTNTCGWNRNPETTVRTIPEAVALPACL